MSQVQITITSKAVHGDRQVARWWTDEYHWQHAEAWLQEAYNSGLLDSYSEQAGSALIMYGATINTSGCASASLVQL